MRESFRPTGTALTETSGRPSRTVLGGVVAALLASLVVSPAPAVAAPNCPSPAGGVAPAETPWALRRLDPASAWRITRGERITVAVIDSGVSPTHPLLKGQVREGRDFNGLPSMQGRCDLAGHGTIVAGIIAGRDDTGAPYSGIAPAARILPVRVLPDTQRTSDPGLPLQIANAIRWSADQDVQVINLSLVTVDHPELARAVDYALGKGVVVVAAAGNRQQEQQDLPAYPAAYPGVIRGRRSRTGKAVTSAARSAATTWTSPRPGWTSSAPPPAVRATSPSRRAAPASPPRTSRARRR
ncbi:S8 family serine peptidase [Micromonospora sp. 4G55]|uniref:S8 family serine peptidase n=1 Tax=Micromonospora sp. 4G55 TaxID=2806102 RepID=UPI002811A0DB|nr:S8 family serine peptidase [Micromonospora sp. 4G55]